MESLKTHLVVWLSGLVTGLILMESWRRLGDRGGPAAEGGADATSRETISPASADKPKGLRSFVAGATAEAERARQLLSGVMPWARESNRIPRRFRAHVEKSANGFDRGQRRLAS